MSEIDSSVAPPPRIWQRPIVWLAVLAVVAGYFGFCRKPTTELDVYLRGSGRMLQGAPVYCTGERSFTYPPLFALPFVPFHFLPRSCQVPLWYAINVAMLGIVFWCIHRRVGPVLRSAGPPAWLFWLSLALLAGRHVLAPLENQSHDLIVFATVVLAVDALCGCRPGMAGFWAGAGTALKCTPLLFAPVLAWQRRFGAILILLLTTGVLTLLPDLVLPAQDGDSWAVHWYQTFIAGIRPGQAADHSSAWAAWGPLNQSLAGSLHRLFRPMDPGMPFHDVTLVVLDLQFVKRLILATQALTFGWLLWVTRPRLAAGLPGSEQAFQRFGEGAALVTAMALLSPTSIKTHFCVLLLPAAFCLADVLYRRRDRVTIAVLTLAFLIGAVTTKDILGDDLGGLILTFGSVTATALALLAATGRVLLQRARDLRQPAAVPATQTARAA